VAGIAETQRVTIAQDLPEDLEINADRRRIGSVLSNLLLNALEVMPSGGRIHITAKTTDTAVVIRVQDTGPGVAPAIRDRLFEPFVTAGKPNGWGLGLASARHMLTEHGGDIWYESPPGGGACFAFSVPLS